MDRLKLQVLAYINIFLTDEAFKELAQQLALLSNGFFTLDAGMPKLGYSIEFVSANPTGPLHIGHGRGGT